MPFPSPAPLVIYSDWIILHRNERIPFFALLILNYSSLCRKLLPRHFQLHVCLSVFFLLLDPTPVRFLSPLRYLRIAELSPSQQDSPNDPNFGRWTSNGTESALVMRRNPLEQIPWSFIKIGDEYDVTSELPFAISHFDLSGFAI